MEETFLAATTDAQRSGMRALAALWAREASDVLRAGLGLRVAAFRDALSGRSPRLTDGLVLRQFVRRRRTSVAAVCTLGVGVAALASVFSLTHRILLRPVPAVQEPDALLSIEIQHDRVAGRRLMPSLELVEVLNQAMEGSGAVAAYRAETMDVDLRGDRAHGVRTHVVSPGYFGILGARPTVGSLDLKFARPSGRPSVVVSHSTWTQSFGRSDILGRDVEIEGVRYQIAGVAAPGFSGPDRFGDTHLWIASDDFLKLPSQATDSELEDAGRPVFSDVFGRSHLAADVIASRLASSFDGLVAERPDVGELDEYHVSLSKASGVPRSARGRIQSVLAPLAGMGALLFLISCANLTSLLLVDTRRRAAEHGIRKALGATRARLTWEMFLEASLVAVFAAILGLCSAAIVIELANRVDINWLPGLGPARVAPAVAAVAVSLSLAGSWLAMAGCLGASSVWSQASLRSRVRRRSLSRVAIAAAQISVSFALLSSAVLLQRSAGALASASMGFDPVGVSFLSAEPTRHGWSDDEVARLLHDVSRDLASAPSVTSVGYSTRRPLGRGLGVMDVTGAGERRDTLQVYVEWIGGEYLEALQLPLLRGAGLDARPPGGRAAALPDEVIVSRSLAMQAFGTLDAVGSDLRVLGEEPTAARVVGVVEDVRYADVRDEAPLVAYAARAQSWFPGFTLFVRSSLPSEEARDLLAAAFSAQAPGVSVLELGPLEAPVARAMAEDRATAMVAMVSAGMAVLLAMVGLHGLVQLTVADRLKELAIRLAIGAPRADVLGVLLRPLLLVLCLGLPMGSILASYGAGVISPRLFGVSASWAVAYLAPAVALLAVSVVSAVEPLSRVLTDDFARRLRDE